MNDTVAVLPVPEREAFWFVHPFRVRYAEADWRGHLFNAHYLTYFGTAMVEYMRALPFDLRGMERTQRAAIHVVRATVEPIVPARFDDAVDVGVRAARLGRSSVTFAQAIFRQGSGEALAAGEMVWVCASRAVHRSMPWPDAFRTVVRAREGLRLVETRA